MAPRAPQRAQRAPTEGQLSRRQEPRPRVGSEDADSKRLARAAPAPWYDVRTSVPGDYEIELSAPDVSRCACCGGMTVRLTRFVSRDDAAFAVYYAAYANNHPDHELAMLIALGDWGEGTDPRKRAAFYCRLRPTSDSYQVMLGDAANSAWRAADIMGAKLSREQALGHPWKATAFDVLDAAMAQDPTLRGFLTRVRCGEVAEPLEKSFHAPDEIFALGEAAGTRAHVRRNLASLDEERFFVRALLPVQVERYGTWHLGAWYEVSRSDYDALSSAGDDPDASPRLRFAGTLANEVGADLGLPIPRHANVVLHVPDPATPPRVDVAASPDLASLMPMPWSATDFEQFAVVHGFL